MRSGPKVPRRSGFNVEFHEIWEEFIGAIKLEACAAKGLHSLLLAHRMRLVALCCVRGIFSLES